MPKTALVLLANGTEELEFVTIANVLRRGEVEVTVAGVPDERPTTGRSQIVITPDTSIQEAITKGPYDAIVLPGGLAGAQTFCKSEIVGVLLAKQQESGGIISAICAAPTAFKAHSIGAGKRITSYPAMADELSKDGIYKYESDSAVVVDGNFITSRGPGTALQFSLTILDQLQGKEKAKQVANGMLFEYN
ncbi:DJ-1alpha [Carabus blaptoides fortunei]